MRWLCVLALPLSFILLSADSLAQEIVSAQSGVVHYLEGAVTIDGVPLDHKPAVFPLLKDNSVLATQKGRIELMLTPGVFLRLDENSSVKMLSTALTDTRLQFVGGSCIVDALAAPGDQIPVTLEFKGASVRFAKPGLYRIDSETGVLQAYSGEAVVEQQDTRTRIDTTRLYFFELAADTRKFSDGADDEFLDWARNRNQVIAEENQMAQADSDDVNADPGLGSGLLPPLFNYTVPNYAVPPLSTYPNFGSISPYGNYFYNSYAPTTLFPLPPLASPLIVFGRGYYGRHTTTTPHWPTSVWSTANHPIHSGYPIGHPIGTYPRLMTPRITTPRPVYSHPIVAPHASSPSVHGGIGRR